MGPMIIHGPSNAHYDIDLGPVFITDCMLATVRGARRITNEPCRVPQGIFRDRERG